METIWRSWFLCFITISQHERKQYPHHPGWVGQHYCTPADLIELDSLVKYWQELVWPYRQESGSATACCITVPTRWLARMHTLPNASTHIHAQWQAAAETRQGSWGKSGERSGRRAGGTRGEGRQRWASSRIAVSRRSAGGSETFLCWSYWRWVLVPYVLPSAIHPSIHPAIFLSKRYLGQEAGCLELKEGRTWW